jgi:hypothetical protein
MGMHHPKRFPAAFLIALVAHAGCMAAPCAPPAAPQEANPAAPIPRGPEAALKFGMASRDVTRVKGRPQDVRLMKAETGRAEVWRYERQVGERVEQVEAAMPNMVSVPGRNNTTRTMQSGEKIVVRQVHHVAMEVVKLLMFTDHHVTVKSSIRQTDQIYGRAPGPARGPQNETSTGSVVSRTDLSWVAAL